MLDPHRCPYCGHEFVSWLHTSYPARIHLAECRKLHATKIAERFATKKNKKGGRRA